MNTATQTAVRPTVSSSDLDELELGAGERRAEDQHHQRRHEAGVVISMPNSTSDSGRTISARSDQPRLDLLAAAQRRRRRRYRPNSDEHAAEHGREIAGPHAQRGAERIVARDHDRGRRRSRSASRRPRNPYCREARASSTSSPLSRQSRSGTLPYRRSSAGAPSLRLDAALLHDALPFVHFAVHELAELGRASSARPRRLRWRTASAPPACPAPAASAACSLLDDRRRRAGRRDDAPPVDAPRSPARRPPRWSARRAAPGCASCRRCRARAACRT